MNSLNHSLTKNQPTIHYENDQSQLNTSVEHKNVVNRQWSDPKPFTLNKEYKRLNKQWSKSKLFTAHSENNEFNNNIDYDQQLKSQLVNPRSSLNGKSSITQKKFEKPMSSNNNIIRKEKYNKIRRLYPTTRFRTLYSNWTPKAQPKSNRSIFNQRMKLILNWFDMWTESQKVKFINNIFLKCTATQFQFIQNFIGENVPLAQVDFAKILPKHLSMRVFSYLDPQSLSRASQVSWHWKFLSEQDAIWIPKCRRFGWYLPYTPSESEFGGWKKHYISNSIGIKMSVDENYGKQDKIWKKYALTDEDFNIPPPAGMKPRGTHTVWGFDPCESRPSWKASSAFPNELEKGAKSLFWGLDPNESVDDDKTMRFGSVPLNSSRIETNKSSLDNILAYQNQSNQINNDTTALKNPPFGCDLVKAGDNEPMAWQKPTLDNVQQLQSLRTCYSGWSNPRIIFISSKLPSSEILLDSVVFGVIPIPYDYESCSIKSLIYDLESILQKRLARSIGVFGHRNSENEMWIVKNQCLSRRNIDDDHIKEFLEALVRNTMPQNEGGHIDLFSPFGGFSAGVEMLSIISTRSKGLFLAPSNPIGKFKNVLSDWYYPETTKDVHPCTAYFVNNKLQRWTELSENLDEISICTRKYLKEKYPHLNETIPKKLIASIVLEASLKNRNLDISQLSTSISNQYQKNKTLFQTEIGSETLIPEKSDSNHYKPAAPLTRKRVAKEVSQQLERNLKYLLVIRDIYYMPLKRASLTITPILNDSNLKIIFSEILLFIPPTEHLLSYLKVSLKEWTQELCLGDLLKTFSNDLLVIYRTFMINYPNSLNLIERSRETNPKFREFLARFDNQSESLMMTLIELFLKPTEWLSDLINLVHWLLSNTPSEHVDVVTLRICLGNLMKINKILVQEKSRVVNTEKINDIEKSIIKCPILTAPGRYFVTYCILKLFDSPRNDVSNTRNSKLFHHMADCGLFILNDSLIFTRVTSNPQPYLKQTIYRYTFVMAVAFSKISLNDIPDRKDLQFAFQIRCGNRKWNLGAKSISQKYHLTNTIRKYIELNVI